ncbi:MAG: nucleotidyl transferase AbiEii/AbiGii toxin family protein, partial [bacterium]
MKEYLFELVKDIELPNQKINLAREYLQAYILKTLFEAGFFHEAAFVGGTALRFLYGLPRFSEDLYFSLVKPGKKYPFVKTIEKIKYELEKSGYIVEVKFSEENTVNFAFVKFQDLLFELGVSALKNQKLSIKLEIDTKPPRGAVIENIITNKFFPISFAAYD